MSVADVDLPGWMGPALREPAAALERTVASGLRIGSGLATSEPQTFYEGLWAHIQASDLTDIEIRQGLFLSPHPILVGDALEAPRPRLPGRLSGLGDAAGDALALRRLAAHVEELEARRIRLTSAFLGPVLNRLVPSSPAARLLAPALAGRNRVTAGSVGYHPVHFPHAGSTLAFDDAGRPIIDLFVLPTTTPRDGGLSLGLSNGVAGDVLPGLMAAERGHLLIYANAQMPWVEGPGHVLSLEEDLRPLVEAGRLTLVVEDRPVPGLPPGSLGDPSDVEVAIAHAVVADVDANLDTMVGRALQVGIGTISAQAVKLLAESEWTGRGYTEMLDPFTYDLLDDGTISGTHLLDDRGIREEMDGLSCTFAMGELDSDFAARLDGDDRVRMTAASRLLQPNAFSGGFGINNVLGIDLAGNVNATARGHHPYSAVGGLATIMRGLADGGVAYLCMKSTFGSGADARSAISPALQPGTPVTLTLPDLLSTARGRIMLVTEHGAVRLDGSPHDVFLRRLISVAHPDHVSQLADAAWELYRVRV